MKYVIIAIIGLNVGCASLPDKVFSGIKEGDSASHVADKLGTPDSFKPNPKNASFDDWVYLEKDKICVIVMKNEIVNRKVCGTKN